MHVCRSSQDRPSPRPAQLSDRLVAEKEMTNVISTEAERGMVTLHRWTLSGELPPKGSKGLSGSLLLLNDCPDVPRDRSARAPARRPGIQEIVAAGDAIDIEHLAGEEEARWLLALERVRVQL